MKLKPSIGRVEAFTLVELLCVMAIIAILAALMLPALNRSQVRVKRIECANNLHQLGMAFQMFMHEHDDNFPMAIPTASGGSQEFVQNGYCAGGEFYFAYRHFQVLSNELSSPALLVCPADTRLAATNFAALQNSNVSYFIGVCAKPSRADSILAGDRNLKIGRLESTTILPCGASETKSLQWTREMHQFKGNILFAGGQVEEWNNAALASGTRAQPVGADLFLPSVAPAATYPGSGYAGNPGFSRAGSEYEAPSTPSPPATPLPATRPENNPPASPVTFNSSQPRPPTVVPTRPPNPPVTTGTIPSAPDRITTNPPATVTIARVEAEPEMSPFDHRVARDLRRIIFGTYLLVLLLILLRLAFLCWRRWQRKKAQRRAGF